jgi:hypothetical protein
LSFVTGLPRAHFDLAPNFRKTGQRITFFAVLFIDAGFICLCFAPKFGLLDWAGFVPGGIPQR